LLLKRKIRIVKNDQLNLLKDNIKKIPRHTIFPLNEDINEMEYTYSKTILEKLNIVAPSKIVTIRPRDKPGMTGHIRRLF